jgi:hypothetical protein
MRRSPLALLDPLGGPSSPDAPDTPNRADRDREACRASFDRSLRAAPVEDEPYRHWLLSDVLPAHIAAAMDALPFAAPPLDGVSGSREIHNNTRRYVDQAAIAAYPACRSLADAFQDPATVAAVEEVTGAALDGCCLRIEYAQDTDGFWLQPHTDLGVKKFTLLYYLGPDDQPDLGTDVYRDAATWSHRAPFTPGGALAFVPSDRTWHGFEPRPIPVVRKSLILNYVTEAWIAREQLAYPDRPVTGRRS